MFSIRCVLFTLIFCFIVSEVRAQYPSDTTPTKIPYNNSSYYSSLPIPVEINDLCKTDSGRLKIIENLDSLSKLDMFYQWSGAKLNKEPGLPDTFEGYLNQAIKERCGGPGYKFILRQEYQFYYYTGGPNQLNRFYCISQNTGGGTENDCDRTFLITLPPGWQVCRLKYDKSTKRHGKIDITPSEWIKANYQGMPRFRGYTIRLTGHGDLFNPSEALVSNVRIFAIRDDHDDEVRRRCDCEIPMGSTNSSPSIQKPIPNTTLSSAPPKMTGHLVNQNGNEIDFVIINSGSTIGRMFYNIAVKTNSSRDFKAYIEGYRDVGPGQSYKAQLHEWGATQWKIGYMQPSIVP